MIKRPDVRAILRDIFRISSHGIYFPSHAILNTSDRILFPTDEIGEISEKFGERSEKIKKKSEKIEDILPCFKIRGQERRKVSALITVVFFLEEEKTWPF